MSIQQALAITIMIIGALGFCVLSVAVIRLVAKKKEPEETNEDWQELESWQSRIIYQN